MGALNLAAGIDCSITPTSARAIPKIHDPVSLVLNCQNCSTWRSAVPDKSGWPSMRQASYPWRSEERTSELQSLMRISYAVFCLKKKKKYNAILNNLIHPLIVTEHKT